MRTSLADRVAAYFRRHRRQWINGRTLSRVGGYAAYRTRISELRTDRGMRIENRVTRHKDCVESHYRYLGRAAQ